MFSFLKLSPLNISNLFPPSNTHVFLSSSAGIGRTGAFCALSVAIDRVKSEGIVDVFHTIKHLRTQRPHMVQTTVRSTPLSKPYNNYYTLINVV